MKFRLPHTFSIIFGLAVIVGICTWFLPAGQFERKFDEASEKELVVPGTYKEVEANPQGVVGITTSFAKGMINAAEVITYVLIVGGAYGVIVKTGAIDSGLRRVIKLLKGRNNLLIAIVMFLFSVGGTTTGMWEETLPFYLIVVPLMVAAGYDPIVGVAILVVGAGTGVMASTVNPFATGVASSIAQVSIQDGYYLRLLCYGVSIVVSIIYVILYANRIKKNPHKSLMFKLRDEYKEHFSGNFDDEHDKFTGRKKLVVFAFLAMIVFMMYSLISLGWWIPEMTMLFLGVAIFAAVITKMKEKDFWEYFISGSKDMLAAALIIGMARGIVIVAQEGVILDTILNSTSNFLSGLSKGSFIVLNELLQIIIAFLVPSSSGHAALTMSIMSPLADIFAIPRSSVVSAFQFASGITNMITPTAGVLMGALTIARVPWVTWVKFILPLLVIQFVITSGILLFSVYAS